MGFLTEPEPDIDPLSIPERRNGKPTQAERRRAKTQAANELRDFQARELAEDFSTGVVAENETFQRLRDELDLSEQQAKIEYARIEYPNLRLRHIAAALGRAEGTVKAHCDAIEQKKKRLRSA